MDNTVVLSADSSSENLIVEEIFKICKDLNLHVNSSMPEAKNKYLSAWHKRGPGET